MILSFCNNKGGTAKTTSVFQLGYIFSNTPAKVLLIDLDPQANLTQCFLSTPPIKHIGTFLINESSFEETCVSINGMDILPSFYKLDEYEPLIFNENGLIDYLKLKQGLSEHEHKYDYILIDCPPALGALTLNALSAVCSVGCDAASNPNFLCTLRVHVQGNLLEQASYARSTMARTYYCGGSGYSWWGFADKGEYSITFAEDNHVNENFNGLFTGKKDPTTLNPACTSAAYSPKPAVQEFATIPHPNEPSGCPFPMVTGNPHASYYNINGFNPTYTIGGTPGFTDQLHGTIHDANGNPIPNVSLNFKNASHYDFSWTQAQIDNKDVPSRPCPRSICWFWYIYRCKWAI